MHTIVFASFRNATQNAAEVLKVDILDLYIGHPIIVMTT